MKKEFVDFPKEYEDVFTNYRSLKKCNIKCVSVSRNTKMSVDQYMSALNSTINDFQMIIYDYLVKIIWLFRRFCYRKKRRRNINSNGWDLDAAFGIFMRNFVGYDNRFITGYNIFQKIASYFDGFYPDFEISNPFEVKYEYPYKYMNLECLILVHLMPERLELLKRGEERKMRYLQFVDYAINYASCYNERHGETFIMYNSPRTRCGFYYITLKAKK